MTTAANYRLQFWDTASGREIKPAVGVGHQTDPAKFSPDGKKVVAGGPTGFLIADAVSGRLLVRPKEPPGSLAVLTFTPDGRTLLTGGEDGVQIWDVNTGQRRARRWAAQDGPVHWIVVSPDGRTFLTTGHSQRAQLWDLATGEPTAPPLPHVSRALGADFSPDGRTLVTGEMGGCVRRWDTGTGKPLGPRLLHSQMVGPVLFWPGRNKVISGCADGLIQVWDIAAPWAGTPERLRIEVEVLTGMELTERGLVRMLDDVTWKDRRKQLVQTPRGVN